MVCFIQLKPIPARCWLLTCKQKWFNRHVCDLKESRNAWWNRKREIQKMIGWHGRETHTWWTVGIGFRKRFFFSLFCVLSAWCFFVFFHFFFTACKQLTVYKLEKYRSSTSRLENYFIIKPLELNWYGTKAWKKEVNKLDCEFHKK